MRALEQLCREEWTGCAPLSHYLPPQPSFTFTQLNILTHFRPKTISSLIKDSPANLIFTLWVNKPVANQALLMKEFCSSIYCEHFCCVLPKNAHVKDIFLNFLTSSFSFPKCSSFHQYMCEKMVTIHGTEGNRRKQNC